MERYQPREYLNKHLEAHRTEEDASILEVPIIEGFSCKLDKENRVEVGDADEGVIFDCSRIDAEEMRERCQSALDRIRRRSKIKKMPFPDLYRINDFSIRKNGRDLHLSEMNEDDINLPIVFTPQEELDLTEIFPEELVFISGDPSKVVNIAKLLHELGHTQRKNDEKARLAFNEPSTYLWEKQAESVLHEERDACAFALKSIRPFVSSEQLREIAKYFGNHCLLSYSDEIRMKLAPQWAHTIKYWVENIIHPDRG